MANIKGQVFIFRELTRKEYKNIREETYHDEYELEETICSVASLYPEGYDFFQRGGAGFAKALSVEILVASGFANAKQFIDILNAQRAQMADFEEIAETVISLVFPNTTDEEMQNWTQKQLMKKLARAEWVMQTIWKMPFEFEQQQAEEGVEIAPPSIQELGAEIREAGGDPMLELKEMIVKKRDHNYVAFPMIGGTKLLGNEEVLENVREQIQGLSKR